jgi:hypothetical protein
MRFLHVRACCVVNNCCLLHTRTWLAAALSSLLGARPCNLMNASSAGSGGKSSNGNRVCQKPCSTSSCTAHGTPACQEQRACHESKITDGLHSKQKHQPRHLKRWCGRGTETSKSCCTLAVCPKQICGTDAAQSTAVAGGDGCGAVAALGCMQTTADRACATHRPLDARCWVLVQQPEQQVTELWRGTCGRQHADNTGMLLQPQHLKRLAWQACASYHSSSSQPEQRWQTCRRMQQGATASKPLQIAAVLGLHHATG